MAQIGDQSWQQCLHIFAFPIPQVEAADSSAMAQIMDPRALPSARCSMPARVTVL